MPNLTEFLLARIAEDEAAANRAWADGGWTAGDGRKVFSPRDLVATAADEGTARFIALNSPKKVLVECAAKRRILELLEDERQRKDIYNRDYPLGLLTTEGDLRARTSSNARWAGLEAAVRALALPYADHPDNPYRDDAGVSR